MASVGAVSFVCLLAIAALASACYYHDKYHEVKRQLEQVSYAMDRSSNLRRKE